MLYSLFDFLNHQFNIPGIGVFQYITFRAGLGILLSLVISTIIGGKIINKLKDLQIGETVRELGLEGQNQKSGTPTMGGIIIFLAIFIPVCLVCDLSNVYIRLVLISTTWMCAIGLADDYIKVYKKNKAGLKAKFKIIGQVVLGLIVSLTMIMSDDIVVRVSLDEAIKENYKIVKKINIQKVDGSIYQVAHVKTGLTNVPFFKGNRLNYDELLSFLGDNSRNFSWLLFIPFVILVITSLSNAVNLTDGIDGLAASTSAVAIVSLMIFAYVSSNTIFADYLKILVVPHSEELVIFCACMIGACIGFLWYNTFPATVFMGDTGSLMLGGIIGSLAILLRKELLIPIMCGVFVIEALSVIVQVAYFKYTKKIQGEGKRILLMAPIHHHFQKKGLHEAKIVSRFLIVAIFLSVIAIITLKVR